MKETTRIRKTYNARLPDSIIIIIIIIATVLYLGLPIITSDIEFKKVDELALVLYEGL